MGWFRARERSWLELLAALCQRRIGQVDGAEARLRDLSNAKSTDQPVLAARWWLKQTEVIRDARAIMNDSEKQIETLIERSKAHVPY